MTVRRLDPVTGDIVTSGTQFISGREEIAQTIKTRLRLFYGEYFRDITDGTQWLEVILNKHSTLSAKDAELKRRILQTDGVINLLSFESDYDIDSRKFTVSASVLTKFGQLEIEQYEGLAV
jgi:hypothetical protein